jgi:hypothetical protein
MPLRLGRRLRRFESYMRDHNSMEGYLGWAQHGLENRWICDEQVGVRFYHPSSIICAPLVQWIEYFATNEGMVVRFHHGVPNNVQVAERPNATVCKTVKPSVQIRPWIPLVGE